MLQFKTSSLSYALEVKLLDKPIVSEYEYPNKFEVCLPCGPRLREIKAPKDFWESIAFIKAFSSATQRMLVADVPWNNYQTN